MISNAHAAGNPFEGYIVDEIEGRWSVIKSDGGMESEKWTVSNAHIGTASDFQISLLVPKQKPMPSRQSAEEIFMACLDKQLHE